MIAIRIRKKIDSETLHIPELRPLIGHEVEIIVLEDQPSSSVDRVDPQAFWKGKTVDELGEGAGGGRLFLQRSQSDRIHRGGFRRI
jgi:hypothetical protein